MGISAVITAAAAAWGRGALTEEPRHKTDPLIKCSADPIKRSDEKTFHVRAYLAE